MADLERREEESLPSTSPSVLDTRQETDAAQLPSLERRSPSTSKAVGPPPPTPKTDGTPIPPPKRDSQNVFEVLGSSFRSTLLSEAGNRRMSAARKAELKGDMERADILRTQAQNYYQQAESIRPEITSIDQVNDFTTGFKYGAALMGQASPSVLTSIAAGTVGGVAGRAFKPVLRSAPTLQRQLPAASSFTAATGSQYETVKGGIVAQQEADPFISQLPVEQREAAAFPTALGSSALEGIVPAGIGKVVGQRLAGQARKSLTPDEFLLTNRGNLARNALGEGATELSQTALEEISLELQNPNRPHTADANDYINSFLGGIAGGIQGHAIGRGLEGLGDVLSARGLPDNTFNRRFGEGERGHIGLKDPGKQRRAVEDLISGTENLEDDIFDAILDPEVVSAVRDSGTNLRELLDVNQTDTLIRRVGGDRQLANQMRAAGLLAHIIDNPNISDQDFQASRELIANTLYPDLGQEESLNLLDSIFDTYQDIVSTSSPMSESESGPETSESNIEYREPDITIQGLPQEDLEDTVLEGQGSDSSNIQVRLKPDDVTDIWNMPGQRIRPSYNETEVIHRPAHVNAPWEMDVLDSEIQANPDADVEPLSNWIRRNNIDPEIYGQKLLEDIKERIVRNRQDPGAVLYEKGLIEDVDPEVAKETGVWRTQKLEKSPYTQEQVLESLVNRSAELSSLLNNGDREGLMRLFDEKYQKGAVTSVTPSKDLSLQKSDIENFSKLNKTGVSKNASNRTKKRQRKALQEMRLFPIVKNKDEGYELLATPEGKGWVAESIAQTMIGKSPKYSNRNTYESTSERESNMDFRRAFSEGIAAAMQTLNIEGFLRENQIQDGKPVGEITADSIAKDPSGRNIIPDVRLSRKPFRSTPEQNREVLGENAPQVQYKQGIRNQVLQEAQQFDATGVLGSGRSMTDLITAAYDRLLDSIPEGPKLNLNIERDFLSRYTEGKDEETQREFFGTDASAKAQFESTLQEYGIDLGSMESASARDKLMLRAILDNLGVGAEQGNVPSAISFIQKVDETIDNLDRRLAGYNADLQALFNHAFNKRKLKGNVELHTSTRTEFEKPADVWAFRKELKLKRDALRDIRDELVAAEQRADERLKQALGETTEGAYGETATIEPSDTAADTTFDPTLGIESKSARDKPPAAPQPRQTVQETLIPLSEERTPASIPEARVRIGGNLKIGERKVLNNARVILRDDATSAGVLLDDISSSDIGYLLIKNIESITNPKKTRTTYFTNLVKNGASIYLSTKSKVKYEEFTALMDSLGYAPWTSDQNFFGPINYREHHRNLKKHKKLIKALKKTDARVAELLQDPSTISEKGQKSLDAAMAAAEARIWGGKDKSKLPKSKDTKKLSEGDQLKQNIKDLRKLIRDNNKKLEAAIAVTTDFGSDKARELFAGYLNMLDASEDGIRAQKDLNRTIYGNRRVIARMKELMKTNKYKLTKADQKRLETDPNFAIAVGFQMWVNGDLQVGKTAQGWFKKIVQTLLNFVGIAMSYEYGEALFTAFQHGDLSSMDDTRTVYRVKTTEFGNLINSVGTNYHKVARKVVRGSNDILRETRVPELVALANRIQADETDDKNADPGFISERRRHLSRFNNMLDAISNKYSDAELRDAFDELLSSNITSKAGRALRDLNTKVYAYMEQAGVEVTDKEGKSVSIKTRNRRPPIVFDSAEVSKDRVGFVKELRDAGLSEVQAESVLAAVLWNDGYLELSDTKHDFGRPPNSTHLYSGLLDVITNKNRNKFRKYENDNPLEVYYTFNRQSTHRAEFTKYFGPHGERMDYAIEAAKAKGLDQARLDFIKYRTIPALMGTLSYNMDPKIRRLYGGILTMQNLAILPLALFASVVDIMGISLRTGNMTDSWRAFRKGIQGIRNPKDDPNFNLARTIGLIEGNILYDRIGDTYNELIDSPFLRKVNHKFFTWNGLEGWTRGMRVAAMQTGISYMMDHQNNAKKLADIGLTKSDLTFTAEGQLDIENNEKLQQALFKWVDSAVLRPSASHRPAWGSDPRFLLIWHLKQFTFSFHHVFNRRVSKSIGEHGVTAATMIPFLSIVPLMLASDFLRNIVAPSAAYESLTFPQLVLRAVQRSSIAGIGTFGFDMMQDIKFDEYPGTSLLGPSFDSVDKFIDAGASESVDLGDALFRLTPGYALTKAWID